MPVRLSPPTRSHEPSRHRRARHRAPSVSQRARARFVGALPSCRSAVGRPALAAVAVTGIVVGGASGSAVLTTSDPADATTAGAGGASSTAASGSASGATGSGTAASGTAGSGVARSATGSASGSSTLAEDRAETLDPSRSGTRSAAPEEVSLDRLGAEAGVSGAATVEAPSDPRDIARAMLPAYGWSAEFSCLDQLYIGESNWDHTATNPTSGAYGIPQSLPAEKMATAGPDWRTNPATQIEWGLDYIESSYGSPCAANSFKLANGWY